MATHLDRNLENRGNGFMRITLDLPDALMEQLKLRAIEQGRKLKDMVAELLRKGLALSTDALTPRDYCSHGTCRLRHQHFRTDCS